MLYVYACTNTGATQFNISITMVLNFNWNEKFLVERPQEIRMIPLYLITTVSLMGATYL